MEFRIYYCILFVLCHVYARVYCAERSVSTSVIGMVELLETEEELLDNLSSFVSDMERKLNTIRSFLNKTRTELGKAKLDVEAYLSNPINSFSLIRRMHMDWVNFLHFLQKPTGVEHLQSMQNKFDKFPTPTDLVEAVDAIRRLQLTYDLKNSDIVAGLLNGKQYDARLSELDSFAIGQELFRQERYFEASYWIYLAHESYVDNDIYDALGFKKQILTELYAETFVKQNLFREALGIIDYGLQLNPTDARLLRRRMTIQLEETINTDKPYAHAIYAVSDYESGCRGLYPLRTNSLLCRYNHTTNDFVKLAPIKMEEISVDPYMILYHDVISDDEIAHLKEMGTSGLKRASVYNETEKKSVVVGTRTSKISWLHDNATEITKRLNQRITDMTGFDVRGSEMLQVMNYGLGGHYDTHYDFFNSSLFSNVVAMQGDRIATVLFYMSDVEQGGATVFPNIKIAVYPQKGSAVMWYNLNNRGEGDDRTMHAACPVIVGSKWVCNKWIRERNQFRSRPCPRQ